MVRNTFQRNERNGRIVYGARLSKQYRKCALSIAGRLRKREGTVSPSWRSAPSGADSAKAHRLRGDDRPGPLTLWNLRSPSQNAPTGERETDLPSQSASKSKLYVYAVPREAPRARKQKRVIRDTVYPFPHSPRDRDSELSTGGIQSGQGRSECTECYVSGIADTMSVLAKSRGSDEAFRL